MAEQSFDESNLEFEVPDTARLPNLTLAIQPGAYAFRKSKLTNQMPSSENRIDIRNVSRRVLYCELVHDEVARTIEQASSLNAGASGGASWLSANIDGSIEQRRITETTKPQDQSIRVASGRWGFFKVAGPFSLIVRTEDGTCLMAMNLDPGAVITVDDDLIDSTLEST